MTGSRFKPGTSGNPKGRPPGAGEVAKLRQSVARHVPAIVRALVKRAKDGDPAAARLLLERVIPPMKAAEQPLDTPIPADGTLAERGRRLLDAASQGDIGPGQASAMLGGLASLAKIIETDELAARIAALEARSNGQP
jgi:hypothetical protein